MIESTKSLFSPVESGRRTASTLPLAVEQMVKCVAFCLARRSSALIATRNSGGYEFVSPAVSGAGCSVASDEILTPDALFFDISAAFVGLTSVGRGSAGTQVCFSGVATVFLGISTGPMAFSASSGLEEAHIKFARVLNYSTSASTMSTSGTSFFFVWSAAAMAFMF